jgi:hypothetical protein
LEILRKSDPDTRQAIISFEKQSVQMFFTPENAIADFCRKVKELWNIPRKLFYLLINGVHEDALWKSRSRDNAVQVKIKGLLGGGKKGTATFTLDGEEFRCWTTHDRWG